jgi:hypothetical protein
MYPEVHQYYLPAIYVKHAVRLGCDIWKIIVTLRLWAFNTIWSSNRLILLLTCYICRVYVLCEFGRIQYGWLKKVQVKRNSLDVEGHWFINCQKPLESPGVIHWHCVGWPRSYRPLKVWISCSFPRKIIKQDHLLWAQKKSCINF